MATMDETVLSLLKTDLGEYTPSELRVSFLRQVISSAKAFIVREGISLSDDSNAATFIEDCQLVEMYAAYLVRKRATAEPMPRMLRYALNNRLTAQKGGGVHAT